MSEATPQELVRLVRGRTLDCRTGILLLPGEQLGHEASLAARFNTDAVDFVRLKAETFRPNARFIRLDRDTLIGELGGLCEGRSYVGQGDTDCFFVYNFDLPLAALDRLERRAVWNFLRDNFRKQAKGVVFALPQTAGELLPDESEQHVWRQSGRWGSVAASTTGIWVAGREM
jgi:hypothetical protein